MGELPHRKNGKEGKAYLSGAGQSALKRNPSFACTIASSRVMAKTAPLLAVYANCAVALPTRATTLAVLMMLPFFLPYFRRLRTACLLPNRTPFTLMLCVKSQISIGVLMASASAACIIPALLNITSTPPQGSMWAIMPLTCSSFDTSHWKVSIWLGWSGRIERTLSMAAVRAEADTSAIKTDAPSRAKRTVVSNPMPLSDVSRGRVERIYKRV